VDQARVAARQEARGSDRRAPTADGEGEEGAAGLEPAKLSFRHTWADWVGHDMADVPKDVPPGLPPAVETTMDVASELLGEDVEALCAKIDRTCQPIDRKPKGRTVVLAAATRNGRVPIDNVVARLEGSDEKLKDEFVVIGAHYDHVGVDDRGRIGCGADDNASGTAALLEIAQALALARPKRTVIACAFGAEEDGLLGSKAFCDSPPVAKEAIVAMINLDMVGRGETSEVAVLGIVQNPSLEDVLERGRKLGKTGVKNVVVRQGEELFQRSDHYSFHRIGVPVLFFFEGLPIEKNRDYHTWRDTLDLVDVDKIANTSKLVLNCLWLLADDADRPPRPRE
jgi:aminopeptidase YwaD